MGICANGQPCKSSFQSCDFTDHSWDRGLFFLVDLDIQRLGCDTNKLGSFPEPLYHFDRDKSDSSNCSGPTPHDSPTGLVRYVFRVLTSTPCSWKWVPNTLGTISRT